MKILSATQIREWDEFTMKNEPISSINLMERAASRCLEWIMMQFPAAPSFDIFCGKGNNGGDGLALARMLMQRAYKVTVHILEFGHMGTDDFQQNLARLHTLPDADIHFIQSTENFHTLSKDSVLIDALFGSGLNRGLEGITAELVEHINRSGCSIVSIDIPSGLFTDRSSKGHVTIHATHTLAFECYKPAFLFAENANAIGEVHILSIGLHPAFNHSVDATYEMTDKEIASMIYKPRDRFAHKGNFGHACLMAGSYGKMGAALLAAKACLRSGVGLLTCHLPICGYTIMQTALPEAMVTTDINENILSHLPENDLSRYNSIGIGPGIGTVAETKMFLREVMDNYRNPLVLDADALNILAVQKDMLGLIPPGSILTPHPKEFERLFGECLNDFDRALLAQQKAEELQCIIVLKGHYTFIALPGGNGRRASVDTKGFFNSTGNAGMAKGGSGDVLTGILTGLTAQGYSSAEAAILGVYLHGAAGDLAAERLSMESMIADDIIDHLSVAFRSVESYSEL